MAELTLPTPTRCTKALLAMMLPLLLLPLFSGEDKAYSANTDSSLTTLAHAICQALKACVLLDWPLPASPVGGNNGKGKGGDNDEAAAMS